MEDIEELAKSLIGMPIEKAKDLYGRSGWVVRAVKVDGKPRMVLQNVMPNRINVETADGAITKVTSVG